MVLPIGFSTRACLPASAAAITIGGMRVMTGANIYGIDVRFPQHLLVVDIDIIDIGVPGTLLRRLFNNVADSGQFYFFRKLLVYRAGVPGIFRLFL